MGGGVRLDSSRSSIRSVVDGGGAGGGRAGDDGDMDQHRGVAGFLRETQKEFGD